jgi:Domain of Unknown Function (DUF1080)
MAIKYLAGRKIECLAADTKPTGAVAGSELSVIDDGYEKWVFDGLTWNPRLSIEQDRFYDDFNAGTYSFSEGGTSPNGKWKNKFLSGGSSGVRNSASGVGNVMWLIPQPVVGGPFFPTASVVTYTLDKFQDFEATLRMRTISQTRTGATPNNWETAWIIWRSGDASGQMGYYFTIKMSGSEFGKSDNIDNSISNHILATPSSPSVTLGQWYNIKVRVVGSRHQVWVDGALIVDYDDIDPSITPSPSRQIQRAGHFNLYCEDADVEFDNVRIMPLYPTSLIDYTQQVNNMTPLPSSNRKSGAYYGTTGGASPAGDNLLNGILTRVGSTDAAVIDDLGIHRSFTTTTTTGANAGISTNVATFRRSHNLVLRAKIKIPSTISNHNFYIGFSNSSTVANSIDPLNNLHGWFVGYRNDASSPTWGVFGNNAQATDSVTAEGLAAVVNKWVNIYTELKATGEMSLKLNNRTPLVITSTNQKPSPSTNLYLHCLITLTGGGVARTLTIDHIEVESSPGIDT